jgi:hypothetical protein
MIININTKLTAGLTELDPSVLVIAVSENPPK